MNAPPERRSWLRVALVLVAVYAGAAMWARSFSNSMMFFPDYASRAEPAGAFRIEVDETISVSALHLPNPAARFTLWHFHGNGEALGDLGPRLEALRASGFSVFAVEYPGYGTSTGEPDERTIYAANRAALHHLREKLGVKTENVVLHGRSLGGGPATEIASRENVAGLILECTFVSAFRVMTRWPLLPGDKFRNLSKLTRVRCPVLVIHGRQDRVIPFWHGEKLYEAVRGPKRRLWVDAAGHNDLLMQAGESYWTALAEFRALLDREPAN